MLAAQNARLAFFLRKRIPSNWKIQLKIQAKTKFTKGGALNRKEEKKDETIEIGLIFNNALAKKIEAVLGFEPKRYKDPEKSIIFTQEFAWSALEKIEELEHKIDAILSAETLPETPKTATQKGWTMPVMPKA